LQEITKKFYIDFQPENPLFPKALKIQLTGKPSLPTYKTQSGKPKE